MPIPFAGNPRALAACQRPPAIAPRQRLGAAGGIDDGQALVHGQAARLGVDAGPVGAAVALAR